ncbi:MAG TPA: DUF6064 family protein [Burkholderiales bacterium]|nr:DUF6064 family protein [Burkholderiales bacterium]
MSLPFTREQFFQAFAGYNEAVWPAQVLLQGLALAAVWLAVARRRDAGPWIAAILALLWAWTGVAYHFVHFRPINPAATLFAAVFLAGAALFLWEGVACARLRFDVTDRTRLAIAGALIGYSLLVYPGLSVMLGHAYPAMPTFGLPCPTTIFTIGVLALLRPPYPRSVFIVPVLWALIGVQATFLLGVYEDLGLIAAPGAGAWLALQGRRTHEQPLVS